MESNEVFGKLCEVGEWISSELGRENGSRVGKAWRGRKERRRMLREKEKGM